MTEELKDAEREAFEARWFNADAFEYGQTDSAWAAWQARAASTQSTAMQPVQPQVTLRCCRMGCDKPSVCERLGMCRIDANAQPVSEAKP